MDQSEIIKAYPSICYKCARSRRPVSEDYLQQGLVGCTLFAEDMSVDTDNIQCEEAWTGWVYLKRKPFGQNACMSGVWTNCQLLIREVTKCKYFISND